MSKRTLKSVADLLPWATKTLYNRGQAGTLPFLSRVGPEGRRTRDWWVDLEILAPWAAARGMDLDLARLQGLPDHQ